MNILHKLIIGGVALAAFTLAAPAAQARGHGGGHGGHFGGHGYYRGGFYGGPGVYFGGAPYYGYGYGYPYPYYNPYPYPYGYYGAPGVTFAFGGHGYYRGGFHGRHR